MSVKPDAGRRAADDGAVQAKRGSTMAGAEKQEAEAWPALPLEAWHDTYATLHRWLQIVGKVRLVQSPWINHCWQVTLYVTPTGLNTSAIPYDDRTFQIDLDFARHRLAIRTSD